MNFSDSGLQADLLDDTGIGTLDYIFTEAKTDLATFAQIKDPIDSRLISSQRASVVQAGQAITSPIDFVSISKAYDSDSYVRTAVDKYVYLVGKEGWRITGKDKAAVEYINTRLRAFQFASGTSFDSALYSAKMNLILFGNSFLVKGRFSKTNPIPGLKITATKQKPIGSLFPAHPSFLQPAFDELGNVSYWSYVAGGGEKAQFKPQDIIHIVYNRISNTVYGAPYFLPSLEDIRTYRQLEWLTVMLVNRYLHPLYHARAGISPDGKVSKTTEQDVATLRDTIKGSTADGFLVTGPNVDIQVKGAESQALRVEGYMTTWRKGRIYPGMRVSDLVMGENTSASRTTGDTVTAEMHDQALAFQKIIQNAINTEVIVPMLLEGGFDVLKQDAPAIFEYKPISFDDTMRRHNDMTQLWLNSMVTENEMREALQMPAITDQERTQTFSALHGKAAVATTTTSPTTGDTTANKVQPAGRQGKKTSPGGKVVPPVKKG
jgi:hypothetical protein